MLEKERPFSVFCPFRPLVFSATGALGSFSTCFCRYIITDLREGGLTAHNMRQNRGASDKRRIAVGIVSFIIDGALCSSSCCRMTVFAAR